MGLASACDICIASAAATFATSEVKFGIIPSAISPYVLRAIGPRQASRYFLTAERIDAHKALEIGLVHEIVEPHDLDGAVHAQFEMLVDGGPKAQAEAKKLIRDIPGKCADDAIAEDTAQRIAKLRIGAEAREGLSAFLEKRSPHWS
jgi:methylglutaconyl-CoA hydratase